jgi:hypothetical protein
MHMGHDVEDRAEGMKRGSYGRRSTGFFLRNLPAFLFVAALVFASLLRGGGGAAERLLAWTLLLPIGVTGLWAGISHVFFPAMAATHAVEIASRIAAHVHRAEAELKSPA